MFAIAQTQLQELSGQPSKRRNGDAEEAISLAILTPARLEKTRQELGFGRVCLSL